jgi:ferric-dicitrate binding protein FerR (iron transport regulator)
MAEPTLAYYLERYAAGTLTAEEATVLIRLLQAPDSDAPLEAILTEHWENWRHSDLQFPEVADRIRQAIARQADAPPLAPVVHRVHFLKRAWFRYAAAAIIVLGIGAYLWNSQKQQEKPAYTKTTVPAPVNNDVAPGGNKALLTLADGQTIVLDSAANGALAEQGAARITKMDNGKIIYQRLEQKLNSPVLYNTMTTPRGGQYQLQLPDGSQVWLNAASSIRYPTRFTGETREVSISGEAYFEVTKDPARPFIVKTQKEDIRVLGTHFNVNAYADDAAMKTSLLKGSVKVGAANLKPGQAYVNGRVIKTDVDQDVAWKNGAFNFNNVTLKEAMRQLSRWYDVDIVYEGTAPDMTFVGEMGRDLTLGQVLKGLDVMGVKFRIEGKKLIVGQ